MVKRKSRLQTLKIMVVKTIVVRNLFSFEYEGSNPSLPTIKYKKTCILFFTTHTNKNLPKGEKMKLEKYLPIGSVVLLDGGETKVMITGFVALSLIHI